MSPFRRQAILSDVHSNIEALEAVLRDAEEQGCEEVVCLGDLIGYGPNPRQVLRIAMERFAFCILGNHEEAVLTQPDGFNWKAAAASVWTRRQIRSPRYPRHESEAMWSWLKSLPRSMRHGDVLYVHGSPMDPTHEYILPESVYNAALMRMMFSKIKRVAFGGHSHLPGIFYPPNRFVPQHEIDAPWDVRRGKFFVNVGSVGQPRDGDVRSCYVVFDGETVLFRRVPYDYRRTARKIRRISKIPDALAARLQYGL